MRETLITKLGFVVLALLGLAATLGLVLWVSHQTEQKIATRLAQAEMANLTAKIGTLSEPQKVIEISTLVASRHLASQIARGADLANASTAQAKNPLRCPTPERDQRIIAAQFSPDQLPGEADTQTAGTPLTWSMIDMRQQAAQEIIIPIAAACNPQKASAQVVVAQFGKTTVVTGWMTEPIIQLASRHWKPASWAFAMLLGIGVCIALLMERKSARQMRHLTSVLQQLGAGNFDARPMAGAHDNDYRQLSGAISVMAEQIKSIHTGLTSLMDRTAHDLRTPLARAMARISSVIAKQSERFDTAELEGVEADLRDLSSRFGAMLTLREAATLNPNLGEPIDLAEIAALAGALYQDLDIGEGKVITLNLAPAWIFAQRGLIQNAVANLLDNALRFTPKGGKVDIVTRSTDRASILTICDSGPGLDPGLGSSVFEAGITTRGHEGGYGLGLATVREVAHRYGGGIKLENCSPKTGVLATLSLASVARPQTLKDLPPI